MWRLLLLGETSELFSLVKLCTPPPQDLKKIPGGGDGRGEGEGQKLLRVLRKFIQIGGDNPP